MSRSMRVRVVSAATVVAAMTGLAAAPAEVGAAPMMKALSQPANLLTFPHVDTVGTKVTYDAQAGRLQVAVTHRGPIPPRQWPFLQYDEQIRLSKRPVGALNSIPDTVQIFAHRYQVTDADGGYGTGDVGPVTVTHRGSTTVYSMQGARLKGPSLNWISGFTSDGAGDFVTFQDAWRERRLG